jgi:TrfA protein
LSEPNDPIIEALAANTQAALRKLEEAAERAKVYQLAFWPEDERALPGDFIACALFTASKATMYVTRYELASINGLTVIFTGKRLTQVHADVWMGIMHLARQRVGGDVLRFRARALLELIGRSTHQSQRNQLKRLISQLQATSVAIQDDGARKRFGGSLLPEHTEDDGLDETGIGETEFSVKISHELAKILSGNFWKVNWDLRKRLQNKPLALWLQTYFCRFKRPIEVSQLHALSGSTAQLKEFRRKLARALQDLQAAGGHHAEIDRDTDLVNAVMRLPRVRRPANDSQEVLPFARKP